MNMTRENSKDVLLADDDLEDYYIFQSAVKQISVAIALRHATDGEMLFEKLREAIPDLLFLDIAMPCKDGVSCLLEIRKNPDYHHMPIVMFTAHNRPSYIKATYENGANFFLVKPNSLPALVKQLEYIFSMHWEKQLYFPPLQEYVLAS